MNERAMLTGKVVVVSVLLALLSYGCRTKGPTVVRLYPELTAMPETQARTFKCEEGHTAKAVIEVPPGREGPLEVILSWAGSAEELEADLYWPDQEEPLAVAAGSSPIRVKHDVWKKPYVQRLHLVVACPAGAADGVMEIHTPVVREGKGIRQFA